MTVDELVKMLKRYDGNMVVEIRVHNPSVGPSRGAKIKNSAGWNRLGQRTAVYLSRKPFG